MAALADGLSMSYMALDMTLARGSVAYLHPVMGKSHLGQVLLGALMYSTAQRVQLHTMGYSQCGPSQLAH